jgi:hypothetical protein
LTVPVARSMTTAAELLLQLLVLLLLVLNS